MPTRVQVPTTFDSDQSHNRTYDRLFDLYHAASAADGIPWRTPLDAPLVYDSLDVPAAKDRLRTALLDIDAFSREHHRGRSGVFEDALERLTSDNPERDFRHGSPWVLAPHSHSLRAWQLVTAQSLPTGYGVVWGMGSSWDHPPEDEKTKRRDGEVLWALSEAVNLGLIASVNDISPPA